MVVGWTDDTASAVDCIRVIRNHWRLMFSGGGLVRVRRQDVEIELGSSESRLFGFVSLIHTPNLVDMPVS